MIRVMWKGGRFDYVKPQLLDELIRRKQIVSFRRNSGFVLVGIDPVRERRDSGYAGKERRRQAAA